MPTSPAAWEGAASELRRIYAEAETIMLQKVARRIERGIEEDGWAEIKLSEVQRIRSELAGEVRKLSREAASEVTKAVTEAYHGGAAEAARDLAKVVEGPIKASFTAANRHSVQRIAAEATQKLQGTHLRILRVADDVYRQTIYEASTQAVVGTMTRREAAQRALDRFADAGITGFVDSAGRRWSIDTYAEMATRTASGRAAVEGHVDRLVENEYDLVIVSVSPAPCEKCDPWEGRVFSLRGLTQGYPLLDEAIEGGMFHPNCTHSVSAYIVGLTEKPERSPKEERGEAYEAKQRQREIERNIRKYKRREAVAITEDAKQDARRMVRKWQGIQREHLEQTGREFKRDYARESITRAR